LRRRHLYGELARVLFGFAAIVGGRGKRLPEIRHHEIGLIHNRHDVWRGRIGNDDRLAVCVMAGNDTTKRSDLGA
jgi:hypothetical protein